MSTYDEPHDIESRRQTQQADHESQAFELSDAAKVAAVAALIERWDDLDFSVDIGRAIVLERLRTALADPDAALERVRAEARAEALRDAAVQVVIERQINPMNGDGGNYRIDQVLQHLDLLAGDHSPSDAAEYAWALRMDKYEDDYCQRHDVPRASSTHVERLEAKRAKAVINDV